MPAERSIGSTDADLSFVRRTLALNLHQNASKTVGQNFRNRKSRSNASISSSLHSGHLVSYEVMNPLESLNHPQSICFSTSSSPD